PHAWVSPTSCRRPLDLVPARQYQQYLAGSTPFEVLTRAALGVWTLAIALGPIGSPAAVAGLALLWDRARGYATFVLALEALLAGLFAVYPARDVESYLLPAVVAAAPAAAVALRALGEWLAGRVGGAAVGWLGAVVRL